MIALLHPLRMLRMLSMLPRLVPPLRVLSELLAVGAHARGDLREDLLEPDLVARQPLHVIEGLGASQNRVLLGIRFKLVSFPFNSPSRPFRFL